MNVQRNDVVLVDFPFADKGSKVRPALVIQNDMDNLRLANTIVTQITGTTRRALEATQVLIDLTTPDGQQSGLLHDSVVNCVNIATVTKIKVLRKLGSLPDSLMLQVNAALKVSLELQ